MQVFSSDSVEQTQELGRLFSSFASPDDVIVLDGDLGAGKTQFTKGFAAGLGVLDEVTSPTFNIMVAYDGDELALFHFDLYRLESEDELEDIDFYGATESGAVCLIEWGSKFADALPEERLDLYIHVEDSGTRRLEASGRGTRGQELERAFAQAAERLSSEGGPGESPALLPN